MRALFLILLAAAVSGQQERPVYRAGVDSVRVDVQVIDGRKVIKDLAREDFLIFDEDQPQEIEYFARDTEPLWIALLLDVSASMRKMLAAMSAASMRALGVLRPEDNVAVILFASHAIVHQEFTRDRKETSLAIEDAQYEKRPGQSTDINSAILQAADYISKAGAGRRAVLILTDNVSMSYRIPDERVLRALYSADAVLNAIVTPEAEAPEKPKKGVVLNPDFSPANVFRLATESGGDVVRASKAGAAFEEMMERIRTRYSLHYRCPRAEPGSFRALKTELSPAARRRFPNAQVRARAGYYVPESSGGAR
jgi:VWFA-related protein